LAETTARRIDWIMKTRRRRKRCETKNSYTKYKITYRRVSKSIVRYLAALHGNQEAVLCKLSLRFIHTINRLGTK
jgi:hypothetical protein